MIHDPFIKVFLPSDFDNLVVGRQAASIAEIHSKGMDSSWMRKSAAAGVFKDADIKSEGGKSFIHLIALGDAERYGMNLNGDVFYGSGRTVNIPYPEKKASKTVEIACGNSDRTATFLKHAKVYRNHINKKDSPSYGDIVAAAHNPEMGRGELIIRVDNDEWADDLQKIASGTPIDFSMAARVPYDICKYCGHKARSRDEYCDHAKNHMTVITKEGHQIGVINDYHTFFDISRVPVRADRVAQGLLKAASSAPLTSRDLLNEMYFNPPPVVDGVITSEDKLKKLAVLKRMAAIEKEIEGRGASIISDPMAMSLVKGVMPDLDGPQISVFAGGGSDSIENKLAALADVKVILSLPDFLKVIAGPQSAASLESECMGAENMLPGIFGKMLGASDLPDILGPSLFDDHTLGVVPRRVQDVIESLGGTHGRIGDPAARRVSITVIRKVPVKKKDTENTDDKKETEKSAAFSKAAAKIAEEYAKYVLAVCARGNNNENTGLTESAVMQNYVC